MRKWVRRHPYLALAVGYVLFYVIAVGVRMLFGTRDILDALVSAFLDTLVYGFLAVVQIRRVRNTNQRLAEQGQFRVYIRYPDSLPGSLSGIWNQGIVTPGEASLRFQPAVYDKP